MKKGRILSGNRPTGRLHLGHYVGALTNWARLQDEYECFYMVADYHALMSEYEDTTGISAYTREMVADWVACGLDPERSTIFVQSHLPEHAELHLIFSTITGVSRLERVPTYKEQIQEIKDRDLTTYAFLGYPVLQAADILIYRAEAVPVGEDQLPHLELTREIARRFNRLYGKVFPEPMAKLTQSPRLLGLDRRKMSKSYDNYVALADPPEVVREKVLSMITDPQRRTLKDPGRPDYCNVHSYYQIFAPDEAEEVARKCRQALWGCTECKAKLAERLNEFLGPIRTKRNQLMNEPGGIEKILEAGSKRASAVAAETMRMVHQALGF